MADNDQAPVLKWAETPADFDAFGHLCRAYIDWCRARYQTLPWFIEEVFGHQSLDAELKVLDAKYGTPLGRTLLAVMDGAVVAGGAYRRLSDTICELKRLYVGDRARGHGLGRRLTEGLMAAARDDGYSLMQLDTADRLTEAIALYQSMGFIQIDPYQTYPEHLMPHLIFMEKGL
jgi:GNAT superfamily N-acetyltransferase